MGKSKPVREPRKVVVLLPCRDMVHAAFAHSLALAVKVFCEQAPKGDQITVLTTYGTVIAKQRQELVRAAQKLGATHAIWLDSDMTFPPDTFLRLLDAGVQVVGCNYSRRKVPLGGTTFRKDGDGKATPISCDPSQVGLMEVDGMGFGVVMTEMRVFDQFPEPHFASPYNTATDRFLGEDIFFCIAARAAGVRLFTDLDLSSEVGHLGTHCFTLEDAHAWTTANS